MDLPPRETNSPGAFLCPSRSLLKDLEKLDESIPVQLRESPDCLSDPLGLPSVPENGFFQRSGFPVLEK